MNAAFADRAVYLPETRTLACADLHLGRGASARVELPLSEHAVPGRLADLCERLAPSEVVLAGDVLHAFGSVPAGVPETLDAIERVVGEAGADLVLTRGNHDTMLDATWEGPVSTHHRVGETVICHGDESPGASAERYVVGHAHPAIEIEGKRRPCYLVGRGVHAGADVLVLPAFNRLAPGVEVNDARAEALRSPLIGSLDAFCPVVRDEDADETLEFPPLGEFRELL